MGYVGSGCGAGLIIGFTAVGVGLGKAEYGLWAFPCKGNTPGSELDITTENAHPAQQSTGGGRGVAGEVCFEGLRFLMFLTHRFGNPHILLRA